MAAAFVLDQPGPPASVLLHFPPLIDETSLFDLATVVRDRNYHAYRNDVTRNQLDQVILANGLITRLTSLLYYTHTLLVRPVVEAGLATDNTNNFSALNQASQDLQRSITEKYNASMRSELRPTIPEGPSSGNKNQERKSFLDDLSPTASSTLTKFLSTLRSDPTFIASRLSLAKEQDLEYLTDWRPHHHKQKLKSSMQARPNTSPLSIDHITSFSRHDPLYALTSTLFSPTASPESWEFHFRLDTWSTALAHLIDENRGSNITSAVMDIFTGPEWAIDSAFEIAILNFLQNAARLNKSVPDDEQDGDDIEPDSELTQLCDQTLAEILGLIGSDGGIPSTAILLANAVSTKCPNKEQARAHIGTHWFHQQFLWKRIITPEVYISCRLRHLTIVFWTSKRVFYQPTAKTSA
jgi:hypothetical protein